MKEKNMIRSTEFEVHLFLSRLDEDPQADNPFAPIIWSRDCAHIMSDSSLNETSFPGFRLSLEDKALALRLL
jgi:hypothetical protein